MQRIYHPLGSIEARFKVIVLLAGSQLSREVICLAYHHQPQLIYPVYQWILIEKTKDQFLRNVEFRYNSVFYNCSRKMMERAIEGTIFTSYRLSDRENHQQLTDVDMTIKQYQTLYREYLDRHLQELVKLHRDSTYEEDAEVYAVSYYDATWALALALNASLGDQFSTLLEDYQHGQPELTGIIRKHLSHLQFEGLMGRIAFRNSTHDSSTPLNIHQCINSVSTHIGIYNRTGLYIFPNKGRFVSDIFHQSVVGVHQGVTITVLIILVICTFYAACLHILFVIFGVQNQKSIKAASVTMSHFMFSGCYLILLRVFLIAVEFSAGWQTRSGDEVYRREVAFGVICNVSEWLNSIGISLVMGTLCGKSWRIYRLFNHFTTKQYLVSDMTLTLFIVCLVSVNVILLVMWAAFDPLLATFEQETIEYSGEDEPVILLRVFCRCQYFSIWISIAFSILLIEVTGVVVLSLLNRRVNRRHFQTTKSVNLMIYLIALSCFLGIGLAFVFESLDIHYTYVSWQFSLLSIVCFVCVFMFSPPAFSALKASLHG